jgi:hypothetical protein
LSALPEFRDIEIELLDHQADALESENPFTLLKGGVGSGKTFTGAMHCNIMAELNPDSPGLIAANSYKQLKDATLTGLLSFLELHKIKHAFKKSAMELYIGKKMFYCRSLDNYDAIRGIEISDAWLDETRDTSPKAFDVVLGRLRHIKTKRFRTLLTTTPNGYDWLHEKFVANPLLGSNMIEATSMDNTFLPDSYIPMLMSAYDERMLRQEVYGEFINIAADAAYYCFDRARNVKTFDFQDLPLWGGVDFNVDPMTACMGWVDENILYVWDEAFLRNSNTPSLRRHLIMKGYTPATLIPDGTGKNRKSNVETGITDHIILAEGGHYDIKKIHNPFVGDRINCVNGLLEKARIIIHPRCVNLIKDLQQVSRGVNDPMLTHISDALGYWAWYLFPITRMHKAKQTRYI